MNTVAPVDERFLWWLGDPAAPRLIGRLRHVPPGTRQPTGVALRLDPAWIDGGFALSEDLPLQPGEFLPTEPGSAVGAVDDARPDRWGERVIRLLDRPPRLGTLEFLWYAGDERFGALGVSASPDRYEPRRHGPLPTLADLPALQTLVRRVEQGETVDEPLRRLVTPGATLGGARPKALLQLDGQPWLLKFGEAGDRVDSAAVEHATMRLAASAGIEVCETRCLALPQGQAIAVRRFDRVGERRLHALSAHVALRAAGVERGYPELALLLRRRAPAEAIASQGEQLFRRMCFNLFVDNTDDHEKNHALLVDARQRYRLAPAYDLLPAAQGLGYQQMRVGEAGSYATLDNALSEHRAFSLTLARARAIAAEVAAVVEGWQDRFAAEGVTPRDLAELRPFIDREALVRERAAARR